MLSCSTKAALLAPLMTIVLGSGLAKADVFAGWQSTLPLGVDCKPTVTESARGNSYDAASRRARVAWMNKVARLYGREYANFKYSRPPNPATWDHYDPDDPMPRASVSRRPCRPAFENELRRKFRPERPDGLF